MSVAVSRRVNSVQSTSNEVIFKIAETQQEREAAFSLLYESYLKTGLGAENPYRQRVTPYHLLPTTTLFVAMLRGEVISTVSLVMDGELGLPMESMFTEEIDQRRQQELLVAEVSCLADRRSRPRHFLENFSQLTRLMAQYARKRGVSQFLAATHPKHSRFYVRYLGFDQISDVASCPHACDKPAVALCLDFEYIDSNPPKCYDIFFGQSISDELLQSHPIPTDELTLLAQVVESCSQAACYQEKAAKSQQFQVA